MHYPWSPMINRKPLRWPNGKKLALIITMNCEYWDLTKDTTDPYYAGGPPMLPDSLPGNVADFPNFTWREYGQRVGVWRMFKLFDEMGARFGITINAKTALERPEIVAYANARNWEIVAHNYEQGELLTKYTFDIDKERQLIAATLAVYEKTVGRKAKGWLSSSLRSTPNMISTPSGPIVNVPYTIELNDFTFFHRRAMSTWDAARMLKDQFDELYRESAESSRIMSIGLHPHVSGHPHRMPCFREFLAHAKGHPDVWWTTREEISSWYLQNHHTHIG